MTAQDLSPKELQVCALLYYTKNSILFEFMALLQLSMEHFPEPFDNFKLYNDIMLGTYCSDPIYGAADDIIDSLINKELIKLVPTQKGRLNVPPFYTLNICDKFKEFFKELKVQTALGSINVDLENVK